jgi:hypothetical protein
MKMEGLLGLCVTWAQICLVTLIMAFGRAKHIVPM